MVNWMITDTIEWNDFKMQLFSIKDIFADVGDK